MNLLVRRLFNELVDVPHAQRDRILSEREITPEVRAEVESLLSFDSTQARSLEGRVSHAAEDALHTGDSGYVSYCGPYRLVRLLGSGGMGTVYLGERKDGEIQQKVAIKLLRSGVDRPAWHDRFLRERQLLAYLNHPSIAHVIDAGHTGDGRPYLALEYVDGVPIDDYARALDLRDQLTLFLRVCDGVSYAHRQLIIHRDLKPSNILVDASGEPKLLDFGIAKLLDGTGDATQTVDRLLTPNYASPEQLRGGNQSTATDIYSLGAVLYKLTTGQSPHEPGPEAFHGAPAIVPRDIAAASRLNPKLPTDIDYILRKALRHEPDERYASVEAFANDVRAFLEWRPVQARSGHFWYRTRKFVRRYWVPSLAAALVTVSISAGLLVAERERALAQRRFLQVRHLANKVLALDAVMRGLPGSTKARHEIVAMSQEYLEALRAESNSDKDLALENGIAYFLLATAQGVPTTSNLGQYAQADQSLRKAEALLEPVLAASPDNRKALMATAEVAHARMILAETDHRREDALAQARKASARIEMLLKLGQPSPSETNTAGQLFCNIALAYKNMHLVEDALRNARRAIEISRPAPTAQRYVGGGLNILADLLRISGNPEGALTAIREAQRTLEKAEFANEVSRRSTVFASILREGLILGEDGDVNLGRQDEAVPVLQRAFDLVEEGARKDPNDASVRILVGSAGRELGAILRHSDPGRALEIYDLALLRLREIGNSAKARREETKLLAGCSYALRALNRTAEAKERIDAAFRLLAATKDYPAASAEPGEEADTTVRALGDYLAGTGQPRQAAEVYGELFGKIMASKPDPRNDLRHATKISGIYQALAELNRRNGESGKSESMFAIRVELWRHWDQKLPRNTFVRRQLDAALLP